MSYLEGVRIESSVEIGIVGVVPSGLVGSHRAVSFKRFQKVAGQLESAAASDFPALHGVCHTLMNGVHAVRFVGVATQNNTPEIAHAAAQLANDGLPLVVCPGLYAEEAAAVASAFVEVGSTATLWLAAPPDATPEAALALRRRLPGPPEVVRMVLPYVRTNSPGRRALESLDPTALIGPLAIGAATHLKGMHEVPKPPSPEVQEELRAAGFGLIVSSGPRRLTALAFPRVAVAPTEKYTAIPSLHQRIEDALDAVCAAYAGRRSFYSTWKSVERDALSVMRRFVGAGEVVTFKLRCDEETNRDRIDGIGIEVWYTVPKRVEEFVLKTRRG